MPSKQLAMATREGFPAMEAMLPTFVDAVIPEQQGNTLSTEDFDPDKHLVSPSLDSVLEAQMAARAACPSPFPLDILGILTRE